MKEVAIRFLKFVGSYHQLQSFYRRSVFVIINNYFKLSFLKYKGIGYTCNFCGAKYRKFVAEYPSSITKKAIECNEVVAGYGEDVYCPNCMSKNRERLVLLVLQHFVNIDGKKILHFSPEKHLYNYLRNKAEVTTVDITPGFYRNIDKKIGYADATSLTFPDNFFDIIIANHILEHIPQDQIAMKEMQRVLKNEGLAILQVPYSEKLENTIEEPDIIDQRKQEMLFGQKDHVRIYAMKDYINRLRLAGFKVEVLPPNSFEAYQKNALQKNECVFLCHKKAASM